MKTLTRILLCLLLTAATLPAPVVINSYQFAAPVAPTYLVNEGAEGSGTPASAGDVTWTDAGTVNWDNATSPLEGEQSFSTLNDGGRTTVTFTSGSERWFRFQYSCETATVFREVLQFRDGSGNSLIEINQLADGRLRAVNGSSPFATVGTSTAAISSGVKAWIWVRLKNVSSTTSEIDLFMSASNTKPAAEFTAATATFNANIAALRFQIPAATSGTVRYDEILVDDVNIGSGAP
jgi:hypothetical protein